MTVATSVTGWTWVVAAAMAVLLLILVLLRYDTYRDRPGWSLGDATRRALLLALLVPFGVVVVLLVPLWLGAALLAVPAIVVLVMALAS